MKVGSKFIRLEWIDKRNKKNVRHTVKEILVDGVPSLKEVDINDGKHRYVITYDDEIL